MAVKGLGWLSDVSIGPAKSGPVCGAQPPPRHAPLLRDSRGGVRRVARVRDRDAAPPRIQAVSNYQLSSILE